MIIHRTSIRKGNDTKHYPRNTATKFVAHHLMLKAMGIHDLVNFEFMDPPSTTTMLTALEDLYILDALTAMGT